MKIRTPYGPLALFAWQRDDAHQGDLGFVHDERYAGREAMEAKAACVRALKVPQ
jgi:hypothetical protein